MKAASTVKVWTTLQEIVQLRDVTEIAPEVEKEELYSTPVLVTFAMKDMTNLILQDMSVKEYWGIGSIWGKEGMRKTATTWEMHDKDNGREKDNEKEITTTEEKEAVAPPTTEGKGPGKDAVSYTHLTLPTIYSV